MLTKFKSNEKLLTYQNNNNSIVYKPMSSGKIGRIPGTKNNRKFQNFQFMLKFPYISA